MTSPISNPFNSTPSSSSSPSESKSSLGSIVNSFSEKYNNPFLGTEEEDYYDQQRLEKAGLTKKTFGSYESFTNQLEELAKQARLSYRSGIKTSRFISSKILMELPEDYFDKYQEELPKLIQWVQNKLNEGGKTALIGNANANPTDEHYQDVAYSEVSSIIFEYMERTPFRGTERSILASLAVDELLGFGPLDPLWRDRKIDEILCNGPFDVQIEIYGKLKRVPACKFRSQEHLDTLINKLYEAIGKRVAKMTPIVAGRLHDNSRMHAVHSSVAPLGPNFSIRRHPEKIWTPQDLIDLGSASPELMEYIGNLIYKGCSFLVIGGTGTGKTTMLNALSGFYSDDARILTLEDNLELKLNPRKLIAAPMECIPAPPDKIGQGVTMQDLVKSALRLRPDGIIVGEVRDGALFDLAQALNTGHFGASSVHANNEFDGMYRLVSLAAQSGLISVEASLPLIAAAFDFIILVERSLQDGSRRITSVSEVAARPEMGPDDKPYLPTYNLWKFIEDKTNSKKITGHWEKRGDISDIRRERRHLDLIPDLSWQELKELSSLKGSEKSH